MRSAFGFAKGLITGTVIGGVIGMMMDPPNTAKIRKIRKKTNRAIKNVGCAIEDLVSN